MPKIAFRYVESGGFRPALPNGDYPMQVSAIAGPVPAKSGHPMLKLSYKVVAPGRYYSTLNPRTGKTEEFELDGFELHRQEAKPDYLSLSPQALWKVKDLLEATETPHTAIPIPPPPGAPPSAKPGWDIDFMTEDLLHKMFVGSVEQEPYTGKDGSSRVGNKVVRYMKVPKE